MIQLKIKYLGLLTILLFILNVADAAKWSSIVKLNGLWRFSVGDDNNWSKPTFNDSNWDKITVPGNWEQYYEGYNGFAWYRNSFDVRMMPDKGAIVVNLGFIDDVDEVFLNGIKIGQTGSFLPNYKTAFSIERKYIIPKNLLQKTNNVIAVRVYDEGQYGGITSGDIGILYDTDAELASVDLSGTWKFSTIRKSGMYEKNYDDRNWENIQVPATWESQGFPDYDGFAFYRTKFNVPAELANTNLYLVLGQIDDMDKVFLNGHLIGRTEYLNDYSRFNKYRAYQLYRVYEIPKSKLESVNVLVVEVMDNMGLGGIYEGPVGIMTYQNAKVILDRNKDDYWLNPVRAVFESIFNW